MGDAPPVLCFDGFTLDAGNRQLLRGGEALEIGSRYFDALLLLARNPGVLVTKDRFMEEIWKGIPVTDEALTQCVRTLRRVLGDDAAAPRFIETVPKHGYRFVASVECREKGEAPPAPAPRLVSPAARLAGATTLGGLLAGMAGGIFYGILGTSGGVAGLATILLLTMALAVLGGAGIGCGMALASLLRGERHWSVILGGAAGGVVVGGLGSELALHGMEALTGVMPPRVTGLFEGLVLGGAAAAALVFGLRLGLGRAAACLLAAGTGGISGGAAALWGGRFYGSTLSLLEEAFPRSRIDMSGPAALFGEEGFATLSQLGTAMLEGAVFAAAIVFVNFAWRVRQP